MSASNNSKNRTERAMAKKKPATGKVPATAKKQPASTKVKQGGGRPQELVKSKKAQSRPSEGTVTKFIVGRSYSYDQLKTAFDGNAPLVLCGYLKSTTIGRWKVVKKLPDAAQYRQLLIDRYTLSIEEIVEYCVALLNEYASIQDEGLKESFFENEEDAEEAAHELESLAADPPELSPEATQIRVSMVPAGGSSRFPEALTPVIRELRQAGYDDDALDVEGWLNDIEDTIQSVHL